MDSIASKQGVTETMGPELLQLLRQIVAELKMLNIKMDKK